MSTFREKLKESIIESISKGGSSEEIADSVVNILIPDVNDQQTLSFRFFEIVELACGEDPEKADAITMTLFELFVFGRIYEQCHPSNYHKELIETLASIVDVKDDDREKILALMERINPYTLTEIEESTVSSVKDAMDVFCNALCADAGYRQGWKANIAMAIYDVITKDPDFENRSETLLEYCNKGAENFLNLLTRN